MLGKGLESLIPPRQPGHGSDTPSDAGVTDSRTLPDSPAGGGPERSDSPNPLPQVLPKEKVPRRSVSDGAVFHIEVERITPNPHQPRRNFDETGIRELAASIREFGFLQPLVVSKVEKETAGGMEVRYELIAGERRLLAAKLLGLERVPAIVRPIDLERERLEMAVVENIQRENLNPVEMARAFARLQDEFRLTQREIAGRVGKSREVVANTLRLLDLPAFIREALEKGEITESHGRLLLAVTDPATQGKLFEDLLAHRLTTRELKNKVRPGASHPRDTQGNDVSPELKMLQEKLSAELGAPVLIHQHGETGKITIAFYSPEELENIVRRLGGEVKE